MLKVNNLTFRYGRRDLPVLRNLSLDIERGGVYGLLGRNGVGKTTLLYLMAGLLTPGQGGVTLDGTDTRRRLPSTLADIFIVPDEVRLPKMTLAEYVKVMAPLYPDFSHEDLCRNIELFGMDGDVNLGELSLGQMKKVYMSFALACNTSFLLMDEPTNGLDIPGRESFRRLIASCMTDGRAIVISTHQVSDIDRLLDHVIILNDSGVLLNRPMSEIGARLKFMVSDTRELVDSALWSRPGIGGTAVIAVNDDGVESEVDLEMLFSLADQSPEVIQYIFRNR